MPAALSRPDGKLRSLTGHEAQRRQSELTAFQALMMLIGGVAVIAMLWLASGDVGESTAGSAYCPFSFSALLAAFEAQPGNGRLPASGPSDRSALRITQIAEQEPEVTFSAGADRGT